MQLSANGRTYFIHFRRHLRLTVCHLYSPESKLALGTAVCHEGEPFIKARGRKIAFTRALRSLPRDERREIWQTLWRQRRVALEDQRARYLDQLTTLPGDNVERILRKLSLSYRRFIARQYEV